MKHLIIIILFAMPIVGMTQLTSSTEPPGVHKFQPLSLPGQQRPLKADKEPLMTIVNIYYVVLAILLLGILTGSVFLFLKTPSNIVRILIVLGAIGGGIFVSFVLLTMIGLTPTPDYSKVGVAKRDLIQVREYLKMNLETIATVIEDDDCRVGLLLSDQAIAVADYGDNKGILVPYKYLDSVISQTGTIQELPSLPKPSTEHWVIETRTSRQSTDTTSLYQITWHLRDLSPSIITIRYAHPDLFFREVASMAGFCRKNMEDAH